MADAGASSGLIGTLFIRFTAQTSELDKNVAESEKKVSHSVEVMDKSVEFLKHSLEALGIAFGIHKIVDFVKDVIEGADQLKKFSEELDIGIETLAGFKFAADKANVGDEFQMGMRKFAAGMREAQVEGSLMQHLFRDILQIDPTKGVEQAFRKVTDQFGQWENGINKMGMAQELFGTRNARFINLLSGGTEGLKKDTEELAKVLGVTYEEAAAKAAEYNDSVTTLKAAFTGLALTFINEALPAVINFNKSFADNLPKYKEIATTIGTGFVIAINAAVLAINSLKAGFQVIAISIVAVTEGLLRFSRMLAEGLVTAFEFWINGAISALNFGARSINAVIEHMPDWIKNRLPGGAGGKVPEIEFFTMRPPTGLNDWITTATDMRKDLTEKFQGTQEDIKGNLSAIGKEFTKGMDGTASAIKDGNKKIDEALNGGILGTKKKPQNVEEIKQNLAAHNAELKKFTGFDAGSNTFPDDPRKQLRGDIAGLTGIAGMSEATRMKEEKTQIAINLHDIEKLRSDHIALSENQNKRLTDMEKLYADKRSAIKIAETKLQLQTASSMFGDLATITGAWAGKQSGIYKTMFAVSKAFAIADATVKIAQGVAAAAANPWPLNLFAMAQVVAATASIVSSIQSVQVEFGGAKELGGPVSPDKAFLVGERGPELFVPSGAGNIIPNNRLGEAGKEPRVVINNYTDAQPVVSHKDDGDGKTVEIMIRKIKNDISSEIRDGRGQIPKALSQTFGLRRGNNK